MSKKRSMINTTTLNLKEILAEKEKEFHGKDDIFSMTLLTNPGYISSSRSIMFTSHLTQALNLTKPDFPKVYTNYENIVGLNSTGYYKSKSNSVVVDRIYKFEENRGFYYLLFTYDKEKDKYDVIEKRNVENLTEIFGYEYNTDVIDSKEVGDKIEKGEVLYKSSSYDEFMNYCYGKNAKFIYMLEPNTIEDAIVCSKSLSEKMISKEVDTVTVSLNDNEVLCNLYGDGDNYKGFPDVGEYVKDKIVLAKRRILNNQVLYDLKASNLRKVNFSSDVPYFCEGRVIDVEIFYNKSIEELTDSKINSQLKKYILEQRRFNEQLFKRCKAIIESGSKYSKEINFFYQKSKMILDPNVKWRKEESVFNNMIIRFVIERDSGLSVGQKITGYEISSFSSNCGNILRVTNY